MADIEILHSPHPDEGAVEPVPIDDAEGEADQSLPEPLPNDLEDGENEPNDNDQEMENGSKDGEEKVQFDDDSSSDNDEDFVVTIGDIKPTVQTPARRFPVQKLDMNVTPTIDGKNVFDVNPGELDDRPWLKSGANIADYFNFGFNEETWNLYAEKQRLLRLEYPTQAEVNRFIMDELRERHGTKEINVPIVLPVHNSGGRNLVTVQNVEAKAPVKVGFSNTSNPVQEHLPPVVRQALENASNKPVQSPLNVNPNVVQTVNLANTSTPTSAPPTVRVVDLTKPPPKFNMPPPSFHAKHPGLESPNTDSQKSDIPSGHVPSGPPTPFNLNVPPPFLRMPAVNLSQPPPTNLGGFRPPGHTGFFNVQQNMPMMGGYGGPPPMNMGGPPNPYGGAIGGHQPQAPHRVNEPPQASRISSDAPPGTGDDEYFGSSRSERREHRDRRRDSDGSDDERRRRRRDRDDRERSSRDGRSTRSRRDDDERYESSRHRDRDSDRKRRSRDRDSERDHKRRREDDRDRRHRHDRSDSRAKSSVVDIGDGPPGV